MSRTEQQRLQVEVESVRVRVRVRICGVRVRVRFRLRVRVGSYYVMLTSAWAMANSGLPSLSSFRLVRLVRMRNS